MHFLFRHSRMTLASYPEAVVSYEASLVIVFSYYSQFNFQTLGGEGGLSEIFKAGHVLNAAVGAHTP